MVSSLCFDFRGERSEVFADFGRRLGEGAKVGIDPVSSDTTAFETA